jgi:hypothetical protein
LNIITNKQKIIWVLPIQIVLVLLIMTICVWGK